MTSDELFNKIAGDLILPGDRPEDVEDMFADIGGILYSRVLLRALEELPESKQEELEKATGPESEPDDVLLFLSKNWPDFTTVVSEEVKKTISAFAGKNSDLVT